MYASPNNYIPQSASVRRQLAVWSIIALGSVLISSAIIAAPLALSSGHLIWALPIYHAFSLVCHQIPERSFFIAGHPFAVCARCFGLYAGFTLATIAYPLVCSLKKTDAPPRKWLFIAAAPLVVDYALGVFGIWNNTHSSRFITGALLGAVSVFYTMPGLLDLGLRLTGGKTQAAIEPVIAFPDVVPAGSRIAPSDYSAPHRRI
ncbi:MAG: hypothetical protein QOF62_3393 [Pyrinomonadaceae bacterium]|jgi:uncharacterized membrane protein|nr:hypothetical protein [Pyrinomonadaceae bacterium]